MNRLEQAAGAAPPGPAMGRVVDEVPGSLGDVPARVQPEWAGRWPWLAQGVTWRGPDGAYDFGLSGREPAGEVLGHWRQLRLALGFPATVHARQVHGSRVLSHTMPFEGLLLAGPGDGHVTCLPGVLLAVSVADCVPVYLVAPGRPAGGLLHAGWRGTAAGVLESGIAAVAGAAGTSPADLHIHLGPAICGRCYEVGPEVHAALGLDVPDRPAPLDLRDMLFARACAAGVNPAAVTRSAACTRCRPDVFFSHRAGAEGRQIAFLGLAGR